MKYKDFLFRKEDNRTIIVDKEKRIFTTNDIGYAFLDLLRYKDKDDVIDIISKRFSIDYDIVKSDVDKFLEKLESAKNMLPSEKSMSDAEHRLKVLSVPLTVMWDITEKCNLKCLHCYQGEPESRDISTKECIDIIDKLKAKDVLALDFSGGEPLLREDIFEILDYANQKEFYTTLRSNGTTITTDIARKIKKVGVDEVIVSLDGAKAETHNKRRGKNSFEKTVMGLENLSAESIETIVNFSYNKDNITDVDELLRLCKSFNVSRVNISPVLPVGRATDIQKTLFNEEEICAINTDIWCRYLYMGDYVQTMLSQNSIRHNYRFGTSKCEALTASCVISTDGNIYPCRMFTVLQKYDVGDIRKSDLTSIWQSEKASRFRRETSIENYECVTCADINLCGGPCPAITYQRHGTLAPPPESYTCKTDPSFLDNIKKSIK